MNWSQALDRARRYAEARGIRYAVFGRRLNGRWVYYAKPVNHAAAISHKAGRS